MIVSSENTEPFSHMRGSVPLYNKMKRDNFSFFPHTWECTFKGKETVRTYNLFPTCVGVYLRQALRQNPGFPFSHASGSIPDSYISANAFDGFSHASGSTPMITNSIYKTIAFFPREWECACSWDYLWKKGQLFPTQVGVYLPLENLSEPESLFSHASGSSPVR